MKKILLPLVALIGCLSLAGCDRSPKATAEKFMNAAFNGDAEGAKKLCTAKTGKAVPFIVAAAEEEKEHGNTHTFVAESETITGENAVVQLKDIKKNKAGETTEKKSDKLDLLKVDGQWKVDLHK